MFNVFFGLLREVSTALGKSGVNVKLVWGFLWSWYMLIIIPSMTAAYFFITRLPEGLVGRIQGFIGNNLDIAKSIAYDCTPLILDVQEFIECIPGQ